MRLLIEQIFRATPFHTRMRWRVLLLSAVGSTVIGAIAAHATYRTALAEKVALAELTAIGSRLGNATSSFSRALGRSAVDEDFSHQLPEAIDLQRFLAFAQESCVQSSAVLSTAQVQPRTVADEQLSRTDLTLAVRATYPNLKAVLADVLDRFPAATLVHLSLQRFGATTDSEAKVQFALWARPQGSLPSVAALASAPDRH